MIRTIRTVARSAALITGAALVLACGGSDDPGAPVTGGVDAGTAAESSSAADATDAAQAAAGSATDVAAPGTAPSAVQTCIELAAKSDWQGALEPCTRAAEEKPDDLRIRHALQQAQAAAAEGS